MSGCPHDFQAKGFGKRLHLRPFVDSTYRHGPRIAREDQATKDGTISIESFTSTRERCAVTLQMVEALFVLGIDHAGTPGGPATFQRKRISKIIRKFDQASRHTKLALISAVQQTKAPVTLAVNSYLTIQRVSVSTHCHCSSCLYIFTRRTKLVRDMQ